MNEATTYSPFLPQPIVNHKDMQPCRFCGGTFRFIGNHLSIGKPMRHFVSCSDCLARGPLCEGVYEAIQAWNGVPTYPEVNALQFALHQKFRSWFKESVIDFWVEANADYELARLAISVFRSPTTLSRESNNATE